MGSAIAKPAPERIAVSGAIYNGIYAHNNLSCTGGLPSPGPYNLCPDIIGSSSEVTDPQSVFSTPASWAQMYSTEPVAGQNNYYYVRGLNGAAVAQSNIASLYWTPAQLILFPATWKNNPLSASDGTESVALSAAPGAIAVGANPFVWDPEAPSDGSSFYSFVSQINDSENSNPIPASVSWLDMAQLLTHGLGFGLRNTCYVDAAASSWTERLMINIPASLPAAGQIMLTVAATGLTGCTVGLIADTFLPSQQPILVNPVQITQNQFLTGIQIELPPGFSASLAVQFWAGSGAAPSPGAALNVGAAYVVPPQSLAEAAGRALVDGRLSSRLSALPGIGPTPMATLGGASFILASQD